MESYRDVESRASPMTSARDSLWRNIRAISSMMSGTPNQLPNGQLSSTASVSNNHHEGDDYLAGEPVIIHDENNLHPFQSNHQFLNRSIQNNNTASIMADQVLVSDHQPQQPMVMIDRDKESTLTEDEVRQILEIYNKNVDESTKENDELKLQINQLVVHLKEEEQRVYGVQQEIVELKNQQVSYQADQERASMQVNLLKFFKDCKSKSGFDLEEETQGVKDQLLTEFNLTDDIGIDVMEDLVDQIRQMKQLEYQVNLLEQEQQNLKETQSNLSIQKNQTKWCVNCKKDFKLSDNHENACVYHSGRMKYYSCKGCGNIEYYSCCWRCSKCNPGCKSNKHVSEAD